MSEARTDDDRKRIRVGFHDAVTMSPKALEEWLETDASREVGQKERDSDESTGHASGRRIVRILRTKRDELADDDDDHMQQVVGYVARRPKQRPDGDVRDSRWRRSLMNWGHDPLA